MISTYLNNFKKIGMKTNKNSCPNNTNKKSDLFLKLNLYLLWS